MPQAQSPQYLTIEGPNGRFKMPWSKPVDPTDEEIDAFIKSQEIGAPPVPSAIPSQPQSKFMDRAKNFAQVMTGPAGVLSGVIDPRNAPSATEPLLPAMKSGNKVGDWIYENVVRQTTSPIGVASEVVGGPLIGALGRRAAPILRKVPVIDSFLNRFTKKSTRPPTASGPSGVIDEIGETVKAIEETPSVPNVKVPGVKPKIRTGTDPTKIDLISPTKETADKLFAQGYQFDSVNPDGSFSLLKPQGVIGEKPLSAPTNKGIPSFGKKGTGPKNLAPPSQPPPGVEALQAIAPDPKKKNWMQHPVTEGFIQAGGASKSLMTGIDLSAPLRQGRMLAHRSEFYKSLGPMIKSMASEKGFNDVMESIASHPRFDVAKGAKLALTNLGEELTEREEAIMSKFPTKIPGLGKLYQASNRAYTGYLNKLRMDTFSSLMDDAEKIRGVGKVDDKTITDLTNFINNATGRGDLGALEPAATLLNATFFSPRYVASRMHLLNPHEYYKMDPFVRREALKSVLAMAGSQVAILSLAKMGGAQVTDDPTNADFGKIKIGNTRVDLNAGLQQYVRVAAQLAQGKITSSTSNTEHKLDTGKFGSLSHSDVIKGFVESKEAPLASFLINDMWGKDFKGDPVTIPEAVLKRATPMLIQDLYAIAKDDPKLLPLGIPAAFGASVQTYKPRPKKTGLFPQMK